VNKIEELCIRHYKINQEISKLKATAGQNSWCSNNLQSGVTCITTAYNYVRDYNNESDYGEGVNFEETWDCFEDWLDFKPCNNCVEQRRFKKLRMQKQIERGHVRTAITKIGKKLSSKEDSDEK
jgi:hypothetical protein